MVSACIYMYHMPVPRYSQLNEDQVTSSIGWLPRKMSSKVRCVLTLVNDSAQHKALQDRETKSQELHLLPLENSVRRVRHRSL